MVLILPVVLIPSSRVKASYVFGPIGWAAVISVLIMIQSRSTLAVALATLIDILALYLAIRGARVQVTCRDDRVAIRGWAWSRTVDVDQIYAVAFMPEYRYTPRLCWRDSRGRHRKSPISAFAIGDSNTSLPYDVIVNVRLTAQLRAWIWERQKALGIDPRSLAT